MHSGCTPFSVSALRPHTLLLSLTIRINCGTIELVQILGRVDSAVSPLGMESAYIQTQ